MISNMFIFPPFIIFVAQSGEVFSTNENFFMINNDQVVEPGLTSIFSSGVSNTIEGLEEAWSFDSSLVPTDPQNFIDWTSDGSFSGVPDEVLFSENVPTEDDCALDSSQILGRVRARGSSCTNNLNDVQGSTEIFVPSARRKLCETLQKAFPEADLGSIQLEPVCDLYLDAIILVCSSGDEQDISENTAAIPSHFILKNPTLGPVLNLVQ